jgi:hypothetical protein
VYDNYHNDVANYGNFATKSNISGYSDNFDNLNIATRGLLTRQNNFSVEWIGNFFATETGSYAFQTSSDNGSSYLWIGDAVVNGITSNNALIKNEQDGDTMEYGNINLVKNTYYPIRILYGKDGSSNFNNSSNNRINPRGRGGRGARGGRGGGRGDMFRMGFNTEAPFSFNYGIGFLFSVKVTENDILCKERLKIGFENNDTSINIDKDGLSLGNETLTEKLLGFLTPVTSNIQQQFSNIKTGDNVYSGDSTFNKIIIENDIVINDKNIKTPFQNLISQKRPYAIFRAKDREIFGNNNMNDLRGDFTAETSGVTLDNGSGNGAVASIPFLIGRIGSTIDFEKKFKM